MASSNIERAHTRQKFYAVLLHDTQETRLTHRHNNDHIDPSKTPSNYSFGAAVTYAERAERFRNRITELDNTTNTNRRSDRCEAFMINAPLPPALQNAPDNVRKKWFEEYYKLICDTFGEENIVSADVHVDEVHDYIDAATGQKKTSLEHLQALVIPADKNGVLRSKTVISRGRLTAFHQTEQKMTMDKFGVTYQDGSKRKSKDTMEDLKNKSARREYEQNVAKNKALQSENEILQRTKKQLRKDIAETKSELEQLQQQVQEKREQETALQSKIQALQEQLQQDQAEYKAYLKYRSERRKQRETALQEVWNDEPEEDQPLPSVKRGGREWG